MRNALLDPAISVMTPAPKINQARERQRAYWLALGEFIDAFATVEIFLHFVLRWYLKLTGNMGRAVFSGTRTNVIQGHLQRLADIAVISPERWADLKPIMDQLTAISDCRNTILHYPTAGIGEGQGFASNAIMALTVDRIKSFPISADILDDMTSDLRKMIIHLYDKHMGQRQWPPGSSVDSTDAILRAAWRYKPPLQSQDRSRRGDKSAKPKRQRSASPESPTGRS